MAFNGSGTYALYTPGNPVVSGTTIDVSWGNNTLGDIATALSTVICKDGQTTTTASIPFAQGIAVTTGITTPSTSFALANTVATTVNFAGAASVALNIGNASGLNTISGENLFANQPSFLGYLAVTDSNVTGNGTSRSLQATTEVFDRGADFNAATSIFTAPRTGIYHLVWHVTVEDLSTDATTINVQITTSNRTYLLQSGLNPKAGGLLVSFVLPALADMDAADTAQCSVLVSGMAGDTADVSGSATLLTYFAGMLVC